MTYELRFHVRALKEWKKIPNEIRAQFKKVLERRLEQPCVEKAKLSAPLQDCYKVKLLKSGYRLVYTVNKNACFILVVSVGKRNKALVYNLAKTRL